MVHDSSQGTSMSELRRRDNPLHSLLCKLVSVIDYLLLLYSMTFIKFVFLQSIRFVGVKSVSYQRSPHKRLVILCFFCVWIMLTWDFRKHEWNSLQTILWCVMIIHKPQTESPYPVNAHVLRTCVSVWMESSGLATKLPTLVDANKGCITRTRIYCEEEMEKSVKPIFGATYWSKLLQAVNDCFGCLNTIFCPQTFQSKMDSHCQMEDNSLVLKLMVCPPLCQEVRRSEWGWQTC